MKGRHDGAWRDLNDGRVRVAGAWKRLTRAVAYVGGAWEDVAEFTPPLTVSASPQSTIAGIVGGGTATTLIVTAIPSGGLGPFAYSWARTSGTGGVPLSASSAETRFSRTMAEDETVLNEFTCTVTDSLGNVATTVVSVTFTSIPDDFS